MSKLLACASLLQPFKQGPLKSSFQFLMKGNGFTKIAFSYLHMGSSPMNDYPTGLAIEFEHLFAAYGHSVLPSTIPTIFGI
jgi:hypothetical protein